MYIITSTALRSILNNSSYFFVDILRNLITNKSGYKGISWSKKEKRWLSIISINNRSKRIGSFKNVKEACEARNKFIIENNLKHQMVKYEGESNPY